MPCCGITIEYIYARLKAAEAPGSGAADRLLDELLSVDDGRPYREKRTEDENTGDGKHRCRESIATS